MEQDANADAEDRFATGRVDDEVKGQPLVMTGMERLGRTPLAAFLTAAIGHDASDVHIKPDAEVRVRIRGHLRSLDTSPLSAAQIDQAIHDLLTPEQLAHYHRHGSLDAAYDVDADNRVRLNIYRSRGHTSIACRRVNANVLSYEQLHLPPVLDQIAKVQQGLVLLAGMTGSGKSTTIASMVQQINETRACHIVTIEDPIEYLFKDAKALVDQREIGVDVPNYHEGLRALVREDPDVVLVADMRDHETFRAAIQAAETGHLVFGTIHSNSASGVFSRIYDLFPQNERDLIRGMLSSTLQAVIYQRLVETLLPDVDRVPVVEVLLRTPVVTHYILDGRHEELGDVIRSGQHQGMIEFNNSLVELVEKEYIHPRTAMEVAPSADELKMRLKGIQTETTA